MSVNEYTNKRESRKRPKELNAWKICVYNINAIINGVAEDETFEQIYIKLNRDESKRKWSDYKPFVELNDCMFDGIVKCITYCIGDSFVIYLWFSTNISNMIQKKLDIIQPTQPHFVAFIVSISLISYNMYMYIQCSVSRLSFNLSDGIVAFGRCSKMWTSHRKRTKCIPN